MLTGTVPTMVNGMERSEVMALEATYHLHLIETELRGLVVSTEVVQPGIHEVAPLNKTK